VIANFAINHDGINYYVPPLFDFNLVLYIELSQIPISKAITLKENLQTSRKGNLPILLLQILQSTMMGAITTLT